VFEDAWDAFTPFLAFSPAVRKLLYTTNAIESLKLNEPGDSRMPMFETPGLVGNLASELGP
jgi:hypothetical protein